MQDVDATTKTPFSFAEEIFGYSDRLSQTLAYFVVLAVFLLLVVAWLVGGQPSLDVFPFYLLYLYGVAVGAYFPVALWNSMRLLRSLGRWKEDYFDFAFITKFELIPARGATPTERLLNKLGEVYPEVAGLTKKHSKAIRTKTVLAKKSGLTWDLVIDLNYPRFIRVAWIHRHLGEPEYLLAKVFDGPEPIDVANLQAAGEALRRDLRWQNGSVFTVYLVSSKGFTNEALNAVRDESTKDLSRYPVELVTETAEGYEIPIKD